MERVRLGIPTKRGVAAQAQSGNIKMSGDSEFRKDRVTVSGLRESDIKELLPDGSFKITVYDFDKSEAATTKLLLKIGFESLFKSQKKIFNANDFSHLKLHLNKVDNNQWPLVTVHRFTELKDFQSIPRFMDKKKFSNMGCYLSIKVINDETILFNFKYGVLSYIVNLRSRSIEWARPFLESDKNANLYPEHLKKRLVK